MQDRYSGFYMHVGLEEIVVGSDRNLLGIIGNLLGGIMSIFVEI